MQFTSTRVAASLALALALGITTPLAAQEFTNETPRSWFVEFASPPTADGGSAATIASEHANFRSQAARAGIAHTERYSYSSLFNGFSIRLAAKDVAKLSVLPGVQRIYPVGSIPIPETVATDTADQQDWLKMTGADYAQNELGLRGDGVRVAVIDTGIDYHHPDLGGCFGAGCRVEKGYDFVGDKYDGTNEQVPDPDPMDCAGHGTHVSGIIGADGGGQAGHVTGVAPHVKFHIYRVFGCTGSTASDNVVAALEMALADGADIVSMSLGDDFNSWSESPDAQASDSVSTGPRAPTVAARRAATAAGECTGGRSEAAPSAAADARSGRPACAPTNTPIRSPATSTHACRQASRAAGSASAVRASAPSLRQAGMLAATPQGKPLPSKVLTGATAEAPAANACSDEGQLAYANLGFMPVIGGLDAKIAAEPRALVQSVKLLGTTDPKLQEEMLKTAKAIYK